MHKIDGRTLPNVTLSDVDGWERYIKSEKMSPELIAEFMCLLKREAAKVDGFATLNKLLRAKAMEYYDKLELDHRETIDTEAVKLVYVAPSEVMVIRDRDEAVDELTDEQIRISYKPDINALKTILKKDVLERLLERKPRAHSITLRDNKGEFSEF